MLDAAPEDLLRWLLWIIVGFSLQLVALAAAGAWLQIRRDRWNRLRIACHRHWESEIITYLYGEGRDLTPFQGLGVAERRLFIPFLLRVLATLAGTEGVAIVELYRRLHLSKGLDWRLRSRRPKLRALAALEVGSFQVEPFYPRLRALLGDPVPFVAHTAARALGGTGLISYAGPVLDWVVEQETFQQERLLWILESFGLAFMPWLEARMDARGEPVPREWMIYALLAASTRNAKDTTRLEAMLGTGDIDVQAAALKALGSLGQPEALPAVLAFATHPSWVLRCQAAKTIGSLAGPAALPSLLELLGDPVFAVRRNAAQALSHLGPAGAEALRWVAEDPKADPFARDLAMERLERHGFGADA